MKTKEQQYVDQEAKICRPKEQQYVKTKEQQYVDQGAQYVEQGTTICGSRNNNCGPRNTICATFFIALLLVRRLRTGRPGLYQAVMKPFMT